ncbi:MAG: hypothetical protein RIG63_21755 [Coleofasciculus chthonoplastes F3-SA18-01]|uniref:hypothetical protein n=1 Tax=Coleofasciculus chthonoplastes TaxID=64178 RepID=UPI003301FA54
MSPFVGVYQELLTETELRELVQQQATAPSYYFLRWSHQVSGIVDKLPDNFPSPEGQMFNCDRELRWKWQNEGYSVLVLSNTGEVLGFKSIIDDTEYPRKSENKSYWKTEQRPAYGYLTNETRFPRSLIYPQSLDVRNTSPNQPKLAQRYFIAKPTAMVHFVALTVDMPK